MLRTIRPAFSYAVQQEMIAASPFRTVVKPRVVRRRGVDVYTPEEARRLMEAAPRDCRGAFALMLFAGIRPAEVARLRWGDVRGEFVHITPDAAKTQQVRNVEIEGNLAVWLEGVRGLPGEPVCPKNWKRKCQEAGRVSAEEVRIGVPHVGVGLIWKGGEVRPTGRTSEVTGRPIRSLLIPFDDSPLRELDLSLFEYKQRARGSVHPLRTRSGKMILVDEVKGKGKKAKGEMIGLGVLVARAVIREHADVMPGEEELERCAEGAARDVLDAMARGLVM